MVRAESRAPLALHAELIEAGVGPSNVHVLHEAGRDIIVSANRVAEVDLDYDVDVLKQFAAEGLDLAPYEFDPKLLAEITGLQAGQTDPDAVPEPRKTRIKRGAKIDSLVQVGHACTVGEDNIICAQTGLAGSTVLTAATTGGGNAVAIKTAQPVYSADLLGSY